MPRRRRIPKVRTGQGSVALDREEFAARVRARFYDPKFRAVDAQIDDIIEVAWKNYRDDRKSPRTRPAGKEFADPEFELPLEWLETRRRLHVAERRAKRAGTPSRILLICGASRSDETCPGEMSKTF